MNNEPDYKDNLAFDPAGSMPTCDVDKLKKQLEAKEKMIKELKTDIKRARAYLMSIDYETPALGGNKKDMERALLNIDQYCRDYFGD